MTTAPAGMGPWRRSQSRTSAAVSWWFTSVLTCSAIEITASLRNASVGGSSSMDGKQGCQCAGGSSCVPNWSESTVKTWRNELKPIGPLAVATGVLWGLAMAWYAPVVASRRLLFPVFPILGTAAVRNPQLVKDAARAFPNQVAVGIDARGGRVAVQGWAETTDMQAVELAKAFEGCGVAAIIVTDIARDGLKTGVNVELTGELADAVSIPIIASGGVASVDDLRALKARKGTPIEGSILGRALYDGDIDPTEALLAVR